jgi:hypothetical protein
VVVLTVVLPLGYGERGVVERIDEILSQPLSLRLASPLVQVASGITYLLYNRNDDIKLCLDDFVFP